MSTILAILLQFVWTFSSTAFSNGSLEEVVEVDVIKVQNFLVDDFQKFCTLRHYSNVETYLDNVGDEEEIFHNRPRFAQLSECHKNLRCIPFFGGLVTVIDGIEAVLWNSKNVSIEQLHRSPKPSLRRIVKIIQQCTHVNSVTKDPISGFLTYVTPTCAFAENGCPKAKAATTDTFDRAYIAGNKEKNGLTATSIVAEDTNMVSVVLGIPITSGYYVEKIFPTTDGFGESDGIEIIYDFRPSPESGKLTPDEAWKEREFSKCSDKSGTSIAEFVAESAPHFWMISMLGSVRSTTGNAVKACVSSFTHTLVDNFMRTGELGNSENDLMSSRATLSEENIRRELNKEGTIFNDSRLLSYLSVRQSKVLTAPPTSFSFVVNRIKETAFIATKLAIRRKTTGKETRRTITIPMSTKKANNKINTVRPKKTRTCIEHCSAQSGRKVFNKKLARSQCPNLNYVSRNKNSVQIYDCPPRCENPRSPERRRCPKGKHDSFARCANKDSSEKPEVVPRFEELRERRSENMRTERESARKEFGVALSQDFNYQFNKDKTLESEYNISTFYTRSSIKKQHGPFWAKVKNSKLRIQNETVYESAVFNREKWKCVRNARQITIDRIKSRYKLLKERDIGHDRKQRIASIMPQINVFETLPRNKSVRDLMINIESFLKKNGAAIPRVESRRRKKRIKRRRQSRIIRPKGRKHNKGHVKTHTRKSVCVHQKRRRKSIKRRIASK